MPSKSAFLAFAVILLAYCYLSQDTNMSPLSAAKSANAMVNLAGKQAVVVGGTSGIGHGLAVRLAKAGASVTIVGRSAQRGKEIVNEMKTHGSGQFSFVSCDCFLLSKVSACIDQVSKEHERVDYLALSQGMGSIQGFTPSKEEGLDQKLTLHVFSRAAFMRGLQPNLSKSSDPRVLSVLSAGVHSEYKKYAEDPELSLGTYSIKNAADSAGFYNDILVDSMSRKFPDTTFMHAAPGFVNTNWGTEMPTPIRWLIRGLQKLGGRSMEDNAEYMFLGLTSPQHKGGFRLIDQYGAETAKVTSLHEAARDTVFRDISAMLDAGKAVKK